MRRVQLLCLPLLAWSVKASLWTSSSYAVSCWRDDSMSAKSMTVLPSPIESARIPPVHNFCGSGVEAVAFRKKGCTKKLRATVRRELHKKRLSHRGWLNLSSSSSTFEPKPGASISSLSRAAATEGARTWSTLTRTGPQSQEIL
jgi:hypothetical protein